VMIMDLDHFKEINDTLGHHYGDLLLQEVSHRLQAALRDSDTVARLGGDEFGVLLPRVANSHDATNVAQQLLVALREPFVLEGMRLEIDASIGIALHPVHGEDVEMLNQRADIAMYSAKQAGRGYQIFEPELDRHSPRRLALAGGLRSAISEGQIQLYYQPKADLRTGRIIGAEALARWVHPDYGIVGPGEFVPIAEQTGLIVPIGAWVVEESCRQAAKWANTVDRELSVSVNVSPRQLAAGDFPAIVENALEESGLDPRLLCLEITESAVLADPEAATYALERLKSLGVRLAIDDFGIGYSSLAQLKALLPVDTIKIDKSFVDGLNNNSEDTAIVDAVLRLAAGLNLSAVAEGVETSEQVEALIALGCELSQGFHFARPQPPEELERLLAIDTLGELAA
jgi:diguanylate cyclase (GGDEF)-like protein